MEKNRILSVLIICILVFIIFAAIVIALFIAISNNPIDILSKNYLINNSGIEEKYGTIISIGKYVFYKTIKDESIIKSPYAVETERGRLIVYVTLLKRDEEWVACSFELIEVIPNDR